MFMKEARLTPEEIKHLCLGTERLAVWVHTLPVFLSQGWGCAFPQMNCVPRVYNLLILPFCWRIPPKKSQHSLFRVLEIATWWILSLASMEIVLFTYQFPFPFTRAFLKTRDQVFGIIPPTSQLLQYTWWLGSFTSQFDLLWSMAMAASPHICGRLLGPPAPKIIILPTQSAS